MHQGRAQNILDERELDSWMGSVKCVNEETFSPSDPVDQFNYEAHLTLDGEITLESVMQQDIPEFTACFWLQLIEPGYFEILYEAPDDNGTINVTLTIGREITIYMFGQTRYGHSISSFSVLQS